MYRRKFEYKLLILVCVVSLLLGAAAIAIAGLGGYTPYLRPADPTMDYVPQNVGIYDTYYANFKEPDCRACHGTSTAERHHGTQYALQGDCLHCHSVIPGVVPPERDCKVCHIDAGPIGDLGFPHHNSDLADSDQCTACHDPNLLVETNTVEPPTYEPTSITPTPYACENCHWPSGSVAHEAAWYNGDTNAFLQDWLGWNLAGIGPKPTTWPDSLAHPQPIEANGEVDSGVILWAGGTNTQRPTPWAMVAKPYRPLSGTHHEVNATVYWKCYNCHGSSPDSPPDWVPDDPMLIRYCENCHDVATLHGIAEHTTSNDIYMVNGTANTLVTAGNKCVACHADNLPVLPDPPAAVPVVNTIEPPYGSAGVIISVTPTVAGAFGTKLTNDTVLVAQADAGSCNPADVDYEPVPIYSWAEDEIQFKIPGWTYDPGNLCVRVQKQTTLGLKKSPIASWTLMKHPVISSITPSGGTLSTNAITIDGDGFQVKQEKIAAGYGYSSYVEMHASNDKYRVTKYPKWGMFQIKIKLVSSWTTKPPTINLIDLTDTGVGNPVIDPSQIYEGCWEVYVITDYIKDDGDNKYNYNGQLDLQADDSQYADDVPMGTGTGDELLYREISDPVCFNAADTPYINSISPHKPGHPKIGRVKHGNTVKLIGVNYGPAKHANDKVYICNDNACAVKTAVTPTFWSNTMIKFVAPGPAATKWVRVHVDDATTPDSNILKLIIK